MLATYELIIVMHVQMQLALLARLVSYLQLE